MPAGSPAASGRGGRRGAGRPPTASILPPGLLRPGVSPAQEADRRDRLPVQAVRDPLGGATSGTQTPSSGPTLAPPPGKGRDVLVRNTTASAVPVVAAGKPRPREIKPRTSATQPAGAQPGPLPSTPHTSSPKGPGLTADPSPEATPFPTWSTRPRRPPPGETPWQRRGRVGTRVPGKTHESPWEAVASRKTD